LSAQWQNSLRRWLDVFEGSELVHSFEAVDLEISRGFEENFYNQLDDQGNAWPPRKDDLPHPLLIKTGLMFAAATNPEHPGHMASVNGETLTIGIYDDVVSYAKYHHTGTSRMPSRRVIYASETTVSRAFDAFEDAVTQEIVASF